VSWAGLLGLILLHKRSRQLRRRMAQRSLLALFLALSLLQITACSSSPSSAQTQNPATPFGNQNLIITAADTAGGPSHTLTIQLTVR
jgi:hypothetical protein